MRRSGATFNLHSDSWFLLLPKIVPHGQGKNDSGFLPSLLPFLARCLADPRKDQERLREREVPSCRSRLGPRARLSGVSIILSPSRFAPPPLFLLNGTFLISVWLSTPDQKLISCGLRFYPCCLMFVYTSSPSHMVSNETHWPSSAPSPLFRILQQVC